MPRPVVDIRVADEVWIATALLHREHPRAVDFSQRQIRDRLIREGLTDGERAGVAPHVSIHCVANREPTTGTYRMLFGTTGTRRRLFRRGDPYHPKREHGRMTPTRSDVPPKYAALLDWYEQEWSPVPSGDPLLALAARQRSIWK